jgi:hypothetical protein
MTVVPSRRSTAERVTLALHGLLALPGLVLVGIASLAIVLSLTGSNDDPHGFATAIALALGGIAVAPLLLYVLLVRRWWSGGHRVGLYVADVALLVLALWLLSANYSPGAPWVAAAYGGVAALGAILVASERRATPRVA